jgi:YebC/PmpR family DNA-binding regulatory protein
MEGSVSGHNKWSQIKRKKAVTDHKRSQVFTKYIREITVSAREGGGDPEFNPRLRLAIDMAKSANMPQENIDRAIRRGTGELEGVAYEEIAYEGYAPGGVALYIETTTDNQNRTVAALRNILDKHGGNLGTSGSVAWQFSRKGLIYLDGKRYKEDAILEAVLEAGAEDASLQEDEWIITTTVSAFHPVQVALRKAGIEFSQAEFTMIPQNEVEVTGQEAEKLLKLFELLDDHDDVQKVSSNANIDEKILAEALS